MVIVQNIRHLCLSQLFVKKQWEKVTRSMKYHVNVSNLCFLSMIATLLKSLHIEKYQQRVVNGIYA